MVRAGQSVWHFALYALLWLGRYAARLQIHPQNAVVSAGPRRVQHGQGGGLLRNAVFLPRTPGAGGSAVTGAGVAERDHRNARFDGGRASARHLGAAGTFAAGSATGPGEGHSFRGRAGGVCRGGRHAVAH